jgi:hypothetical protein
MSQTYPPGGHDQTRAGQIILMVSSAVSAVLVIAGLAYATGTGARHQAALAAAGCEPSLFISGLPCTTRPMLASRYTTIAATAGQQLHADMAQYTANQARNLPAATAALAAAVATEQAFGKDLAAITYTPQNRATAVALIQHATSTGTNAVPVAAVTLTPQLTITADTLIHADQALATLTSQQARASSLTQLRSYNHQVQAATTTVQTDMNLISQALRSPPQKF